MMSPRAFPRPRQSFPTRQCDERDVRRARSQTHSSAAAPAMISVSSVVIFACRARL